MLPALLGMAARGAGARAAGSIGSRVAAPARRVTNAPAPASSPTVSTTPTHPMHRMGMIGEVGMSRFNEPSTTSSASTDAVTPVKERGKDVKGLLSKALRLLSSIDLAMRSQLAHSKFVYTQDVRQDREQRLEHPTNQPQDARRDPEHGQEKSQGGGMGMLGGLGLIGGLSILATTLGSQISSAIRGLLPSIPGMPSMPSIPNVSDLLPDSVTGRGPGGPNERPAAPAGTPSGGTPGRGRGGDGAPGVPIANTQITPGRRLVLQYVSRHEANRRGNPYESAEPSTHIPGMTNLTLSQALALSRQRRARRDSSGAIGRYQFIPATLQLAIRRSRLDPNTTRFSPAVQDQLANILLDRRGARQYFANPTPENLQRFQQGLAQEWASVPSPLTGRSHYHGIQRNRSFGRVETGRQVLRDASAMDRGQMEPYSLADESVGSSPRSGRGRVGSQPPAPAQRVTAEQAIAARTRRIQQAPGRLHIPTGGTVISDNGRGDVTIALPGYQQPMPQQRAVPDPNARRSGRDYQWYFGAGRMY